MRRRHYSLLENPPRPHYEKNFGHQLEEVVASFIRGKIGFKSEHSTLEEDLTGGKDIVVLVGDKLRRPFQVTMTTNPDVLRAKKSRGIPLIVIPKEDVEKAWHKFERQKEENPDLRFDYTFLPPRAQEAIVRGLIQDPLVKRHLLNRAQRITDLER